MKAKAHIMRLAALAIALVAAAGAPGRAAGVRKPAINVPQAVVAPSPSPQFIDPEKVSEVLLRNRTRQLGAPDAGHKVLGFYASRDWRNEIDSYWGPGRKTKKKLKIFKRFWRTIDSEFACFQDLDVDWDALRARYQAEIESGVSAGRFAAIMNHLSRALRETHTVVIDMAVNFQTPLGPGVPLLLNGGWLENGYFGAGLTPLDDGTLLVYQVVPDHPLGLEVGDIVLGYDGVLWKDLYPQLLAAELPLSPLWWGSSPSSYEHSWLNAAGLNWHLFDTIDVIKHGTGETMHLSTRRLAGKSMRLFCTEQLPVPGVAFPADAITKPISYGIVEETRIGYIYVWSWRASAEKDFRDAVAALVNGTDGLIIDFRLNLGGNMFLSNAGLELLFSQPRATIGFALRSNPADHLAMRPASGESNYVIPSNGIGYNKPIAVLVGPGAASSGDQVALRLRFHPRARFFGKPTSSAFNAPVFGLDLGDPNWLGSFAQADAYLVSQPNHYLTHDEFPVDEPVWHTQGSVVNGRDAVVDAAIAWITRSNAAELGAGGEFLSAGTALLPVSRFGQGRSPYRPESAPSFIEEPEGTTFFHARPFDSTSSPGGGGPSKEFRLPVTLADFEGRNRHPDSLRRRADRRRHRRFRSFGSLLRTGSGQ